MLSNSHLNAHIKVKKKHQKTQMIYHLLFCKMPTNISYTEALSCLLPIIQALNLCRNENNYKIMYIFNDTNI